jgi:transcriptional regulator with XRE-family HTH domain
MQEDVLIQISNRIKDLRREKGITVQELADKADVSKGLISQIENGRTIPSLIVLIDIIKSLDINLDKFFSEITTRHDKSLILVKRREEYQHFEKEQAEGFHYHRIFTQSIKNSTIDIVLLELEEKAQRPLISTEAFEYKYIISGKAKFIFEDHEIEFNAGDSMLFDGRLPHSPRNIGKGKLSMLAIYFFEQGNK